MKKLDNRGASLVLAIVVMAMVGVMGAASLFMSVQNFQMKETDLAVKDSFYTAESLLDYIKAGFREDVSFAYGEAMKFALQNYFDPSKKGEIDTKDKKGRYDSFKFVYLKSLAECIAPGATDDNITNGGSYDIKKLKNFLPDEYITNAETQTKPYVVLKTKMDIHGNSTYRQTGEGTVIEGIELKFVDERGFVSVIHSDLLLKIPPLDFKNVANLPSVFKYTLIGNEGVTFENNSNYSITGNIYSGSEYVIQPNTNLNENSFLLKNSAKVDFNPQSNLIAEGDVILGSSSFMNMKDHTELWTKNLVVDSGKVFLGGDNFVADDLTLKGVRPTVSFQTGAKYYGYGSSKNNENIALMKAAAENSSILVNGKESSLDLSGLRALMLGGHAYIGTKKKNDTIVGAESSGLDIRMGESIAVKGNQVAYLMPVEWINVNRETKQSKFLRNPISYQEYQEMMNTIEAQDPDKQDEGYDEVNIDVLSLRLGHSFRYYLPNNNVKQFYTRIFVPTGNGTGLVYYYINLPYAEAGEYFKDFVANSAGNQEIKDYTKFYTNTIQALNESIPVSMAGGYVKTFSDGTKPVYINAKSMDIPDFKEDYKSNFLALSRKLTKDINQLNTGEDKELLFYNILDKTKLNSFTGETIIKTDDIGVTYQAVITRGNYTYNGDSPTGEKICLIIAEGNVTVNQSFKGTILAKGQVTVNGAGNLEIDQTGILKKLLRQDISTTDASKGKLYEIFKDGKYLVGVTSADEKNNFNIDNPDHFIQYMNWKKK